MALQGYNFGNGYISWALARDIYPGHNGIDISFANCYSVFIEHGDGWISAYGHLSALAVSSGETVTQGQLIGYIGSTGNSAGPHLQLALYHNGDADIGCQNYAELAWPQYQE